jgi:hypothetical protein
MNTVAENNNLILNFKGLNKFTTEDVFRFYSNAMPKIKRATVNWRIYNLVQRGVLKRIGRGMYSLGNEKTFIPFPDRKVKVINSLLRKRFPFITHCIWRISALKEFYRHITAIDFLLVEVEHETVDSVFHFLKESFKNIFREPSKDIIADFVADLTNAIVVKTLITESPLQVNNGVSVPALEKILVDLYTEKELFYFIQGNEFLNIFKSAAEKYTINSDKLLRYANRRGKKEEMQNIVNQINGNNPE